MTNGEIIQKVFNCEVCEPIIEDDIIHVIFADKKDSAIGFDWSWWNTEYKEHKSEAKIDCIDRAELLKAMDTWNKFGNVPYEGLIRLRTPALQDLYVPYVKYDDMVNCVKGMSSVTPQERKGHWVYDYISADGHRTYHCSKCGCYLQPKHSEPLRSFKWCSLCGAKMVESQESEGKE